MKTFILSLLLVVGANWFAAPVAAATDDFRLWCEPRGGSIACSIQNVSFKVIEYSSYTIGYHEAIIVERYDAASGRWMAVSMRTNAHRLYKGGAATIRDVRRVAPLAIVPPERQDSKSPEVSFIVRLADYDLPQGDELLLRITQIMGTCVGSELPVWKGRVTSSPIRYPPKRAGVDAGFAVLSEFTSHRPGTTQHERWAGSA
jgi:hypothetical protein